MNPPNIYYFIGVMHDPPNSRPAWEGNLIALRERDYHLAIYKGLGSHDEGSEGSVSSWLETRPFTRWYYHERKGSGIEPPGWFDRELTSMGCGWFLPLAHRIAAGEKVPLEEITATYSANNHSQPMPRGTLAELFAYAKQHGLLK